MGWLLKDDTLNADHYGATLQHLRNVIKAKRPVMFSHRIILLHGNARPHSARTTHEKLQHYRWEFLLHLSYSPDLSPCDYYMFRPRETHKGPCFVILLWAHMFRKPSHCDITDSHRTSTYVLTDSRNCGMPVRTSMRHMPNNLIIRLRSTHSLPIQQTTLI